VSISGVALSSKPKVGTGGTAWGTTQAVLARKRRLPLIAGGAVLAVAVVATGAFMFTHRSSDADKDKASAASSTQAPIVIPTVATTQAPALTAAPTTFDMPATSVSQATAVTPTHAPGAAAAGTARGTAKPTQTGGPKSAAPTVTAPPKNFE